MQPTTYMQCNTIFQYILLTNYTDSFREESLPMLYFYFFRKMSSFLLCCFYKVVVEALVFSHNYITFFLFVNLQKVYKFKCSL